MADSNKAEPKKNGTLPKLPLNGRNPTAGTPGSSVDGSPPSTPTYEDEPMVLKPFCECANCSHWASSTSWSTPRDFAFRERTSEEDSKVGANMTLLRKPDVERTPRKISTYRLNCLESSNKANMKLLVQGLMIPHPATLVSDTYFHKFIQQSLHNLDYMYSSYAQPFVWPAMFRQMNILEINGPRCGKTLSYLPALCSFALEHEKYSNLSRHKGPMIVILCRGSQVCEEIYDLTRRLYGNVASRPKVSILTAPLPKSPRTDILITIPAALLDALKTGLFNLKRLCHLVIEDASTLLRTQKKDVYSVFRVVDQMLEHRNVDQRVQLVVTSERWTKDLEQLLDQMNAIPLVCIGNLLEAALYGNIGLEMKFLLSERKKKYLEDTIRKHYRVNKTLVLCNDPELPELEDWLSSNGIDVLSVSDSSSKDEIEHAEATFNAAKCGGFKVLLATYHVFLTLMNTTDVTWLINYSLPSKWQKFTSSFIAMLSHIRSPLEKSEAVVRCRSFVMVDETSEKHVSDILGLLRRLNKGLPADQQKFLEALEQRKKSNANLCPDLKLHGKCPQQFSCQHRHHVTDLDTASEHDLPQSGTIKFKILEHLDVTQFIVQIIEHENFTEEKTPPKTYSDADLLKPFANDIQKVRPQTVQIGQVYLYCKFDKDGKEFMLCRAVGFKEGGLVEVKMLETGDTLHTLKVKLYQLPPNVKVAEAFLCNLIPLFEDRNYSAAAYRLSNAKLKQKKFLTIQFTATVRLQLGTTLWIDNVAQRAHIEHTDVTALNLSKFLQNFNVCKHNDKVMHALYEMCRKNNVSMPQYVKPRTSEKSAAAAKVKEVPTQEAFLEEEDDDVNEVFLSSAVSPHEFYVRLTKFQSLLETLESDVTQSAKATNAPQTIVVGKHYLAPEPNGHNYSRARVLNVKATKVLVFYVDYGDEAFVDVSELRPIHDKFITRLPFQAIQCSLYGVAPVDEDEDWLYDATSALYKFLHEPESDIFRSLYARVQQKEKLDPGERTKYRYGIGLKDGYGSRNLLINQFLVDCGFAKRTSSEEAFDFELPPIETASFDGFDDGSDSEGSKEEKWKMESGEKAPAEKVYINGYEIVEDEFELEIPDKEQFFQHWGIDVSPEMQKQITEVEAAQQLLRLTESGEQTTTNNDRTVQLPSRSQLDASKSDESFDNSANDAATSACQPEDDDIDMSDCLTPEVWWSQDDTTVRIRIALVGVEEYQVKLIRRRMFYFKTTLDDRNYELRFTLHNATDIKEHSAKGQEVLISLTKTKSEEWQQLTATGKRLRYVHYEYTEDQLKEPAPKKILQLDITDDESSADEDNDPDSKNLVYFECSDMDSDFDQEVVSSDEG